MTVVHIVSASYSGSTWLNLMLGAHSQAFSIGEMDVIAKTGRATCSFHGEKCSLWSQYDPDAPENAFAQIAQFTGKQMLIANNVRYMRGSFDDPRITHRALFLMRDGRGRRSEHAAQAAELFDLASDPFVDPWHQEA